MAVRILSPTSQLVDRSGGVTLAWESDYPQSAYEVLYRRKGQAEWSTLGKVTSTATQLTLDTAKFVDGVEYHYRVVCYANETYSDADTAYTGSDSSAAYSLILVPASTATLKVKGSTGMVEVPLYEDLQGEGPELKVRLPSGIGRAPMVERGTALAGPFSLQLSGGVRAAAGGTANCEATGVDGETDLDVQVRYYESYQYQQAYAYSYNYQYSYAYTEWGVGTFTGYTTFHYNAEGYSPSYYAYIAYNNVAYTYYSYYTYPATGYAYTTGEDTAYENRYHYAENYYHYSIDQ